MRVRRRTAVFCAAALLAGAAVLLRARLLDGLIALTTRTVLAAVDDPRRMRVRLGGWQPAVTAGSLSLQHVGDLAVRLQRLAGYGDSPVARRGSAVAHAIAGNFETAASSLESIPLPERDSAIWSDLVAMHTAAAEQALAHDHVLAALDAAAHVPHSPAATYNRALLATRLGIAPLAAALWTAYLRDDSTSVWAAAAREHLAALAASDADSWAAAQAGPLDDAALIRLADALPQQARTNAQAVYLRQWAEAFLARDGLTSAAALHRVRVIATRLRERSGESLLADTVAVIDADPAAAANTAQGIVATAEGRALQVTNRLAEAEPALLRAQSLLREAHSPMAETAAFYRACVIYDQNRPDEAAPQLSALLASAGASHLATRAMASYELAMLEASRGHWSDSLRHADAARTLFDHLGEHGYAAMVGILESEDYDFVGRPERAWTVGTAALRDAVAAGDFYRARVALAVLCRVELRQAHWSWALALVTLEEDLTASVARPHAQSTMMRSAFNAILQDDTLLRRAAAQERLGRHDEAARSLARAFLSAQSLTDRGPRDKAVAEVSGVAGVCLRRDEPRRALALLSDAIAFQRLADRALLLPEMLLERGRTYLTMGNRAAAKADFDEGIARLESQRSRLHDDELKPGVFDDAADLFDEATSLALARGDDGAAFDYVERGRAAALREQMTEGEVPRMTAANVVRTVPAGELLVEYAALADRLVIFLAGDGRLSVQTVPLARAALERDAQALTQALANDGSNVDVQRLAATLDEALIRPIRARIRLATSVVFVPDAAIQQLPFAALFDRASGTYLVEQKALITTMPSASIYAALVRRAAEPRAPFAGSVAVFANPRFRRDLFPDLARLDAAEETASAVARPYRTALVRVRAEATAAAFLREAPQAEVVEFAGHALLDLNEPWRSELLFASTGGSDRGTITSRDIAGMDFHHTRCVVLDACSTLRGRSGRVEGVASIGRMFLVAGVPAVIGTLWDVEDVPSADFALALHQHLARGTPPAAALRETQLAALHSSDPNQRHPGYWAAFGILGAPDRRE
jgi:CHAT domain-containing protein